MTRRLFGALLLATLVACSPAVVAPAAAPTAAPPQPTIAITPSLEPPPSLAPFPTPTLEPGAFVPADLDGVLTSPELAHRLPIGVSIDDSRAARPQSGFNAASMVWQAHADGYESRYLLVFQEQDSAAIGPVRSARNFLAHWTAELRGALAHYGGDRLTRQWMVAHRRELFTDVDGMGAGNPAYHRTHDRAAPHNAYTSTADLWRVAGKLGGAAAINAAVHVRPFRDDSPETLRGASQAITVPYHTVSIGYRYDPATNAYLRSVNGKPHIDPGDGKRVTARTVVVLFMKFRTDSHIEPGHNRPVLTYVGSGKALFFTEGKVVQGSWSKTGEVRPTMFLGPDGNELPLIRGRIFVQVVMPSTKVTVH
jgi:hypothetical protein